MTTTSSGKQGTQRLAGYPSYATFIARDKDAATYRKFESLSARNLLYLQSELNKIHARVEALDRDDAKDIGNEIAQKAARLWDHFANDDNEDARARRELWEMVRNKIKEYRTFGRSNNTMKLCSPLIGGEN